MARPARSSIWLIWDPDAPRIARWQQPILDDPPWPLSKTRKTNGSHTACGLPVYQVIITVVICGDLWWFVDICGAFLRNKTGASRPTVPTCRESGWHVPRNPTNPEPCTVVDLSASEWPVQEGHRGSRGLVRPLNPSKNLNPLTRSHSKIKVLSHSKSHSKSHRLRSSCKTLALCGETDRNRPQNLTNFSVAKLRRNAANAVKFWN